MRHEAAHNYLWPSRIALTVEKLQFWKNITLYSPNSNELEEQISAQAPPPLVTLLMQLKI